MWTRTEPLTNREQMNYLVTLGFDELHEQIEAGTAEPAETWVTFLGELALKVLDIKQ
jgi:hypothetical protein